MKNLINENYYKTSDLALVATLSLSFQVESVEKTDTRRVLFVFPNSEELNATVNSYWRGELRVEPQEFFNQLKVIKTRIYSNS